jgi:hypothetical protein
MEIYVSAPDHMADEWMEEAEEAGMSRSEWIRYRIEAGRAQLVALDPRTGDESSDNLRTDVTEVIPERDETSDEQKALSPDEIVDEVLNPIEDDVYDLLSELQDDGVIGFDPREEGYYHR